MSPNNPVPQKQIINLCYKVEGYLYSGHQNAYAYLVFTYGQKIHINGSVGRDGENHTQDVRLVKKLLYNLNIYRGSIDSTVDDMLISAIERFQRDFASQVPDGRIDVRGKTLKILKIASVKGVFIKLVRRISQADHTQKIKECVNFVAPSQVGQYEIRYNLFPLIVSYSLGIDIERNGSPVTALNIDHERQVMNHLLEYPYQMEKLCDLNVIPEGAVIDHPFATYLRVNDKFPSVTERIKPGYSEKPVRFSWSVRPNKKNVEHCFRLYPDQDWSPWGKVNEAEYYFMGPGTHTFEVDSRYSDVDGSWKKTPKAEYEFILEKAFVSEPVVISKSSTAKSSSSGVSAKSVPKPEEIYSGSKALLIGVTEFQDPNFMPLPYVHQDVLNMKSCFERVGFEVDVLEGRITRNEIITKLEEMISRAQKDDRLILYFSTHGFQDKIVKSRAYVATYDCSIDEPSVNGIELSYLESILQRAIQREIKHLLIILDMCSSGLGIISKSPEYKEISTIAVEKGAHMITAGMADQEAQMDSSLQMSTFTYYFIEGLSGKADYTNDTVISLTELLLFVRYQVAKKTQGEQTPMMGRISGPGEMIFFLR